MANEQVGGRRVAVIVVHGVGDTEPGVALNEVVDTLADHFGDRFEAQTYSEVYRLKSPPIIRGEQADPFLAFARSARLTQTGDQVRFYDLHWADLTRMLPGRLNAFLGAFRIIFESHHFIDAMLPKDAGPLTKALRRLLIWAAAILRGPIVGISACLVAVALVIYMGWNRLPRVAQWLNGRGWNIDLETLIVSIIIGLMVGLLVVALAMFYRRARSRETEWNDVAIATVFGALFVAAFALLIYLFPTVQFLRGLPGDPPKSPMCVYVERFYYISQSIRIVWYLLVIAGLALVTWLFWFGRHRSNEVRAGAAMAATSIVVLQSALWLTLISAFAVPIMRQAQNQKMDSTACGLEGLYVSFAGTVSLLVSVAILFLLTYWVRASIARMRFLPLQRRAGMMPRMLFGGAISLAILVGAAAQAGMFSVAYITAFIDNNALFKAFEDMLAPGANAFYKQILAYKGWFAFSVGVVAFGVSALIGASSNTALHIARDLIDHQYTPRLGYSHYLLPKRWRVAPRRPRRARIRERLNTLTREVICGEPFDDVVFVAHSQGSVIVYDYLRYGGTDCRRLLQARPHVVTFGSPLGHLYQFYFKEYAGLDMGISALRRHLSSWTNLYRVDDYVGREVGQSNDAFVKNRILGPGGHIDYWKEKALAEVILERISTPRSPQH
jgi:hypothetical protein